MRGDGQPVHQYFGRAAVALLRLVASLTVSAEECRQLYFHAVDKDNTGNKDGSILSTGYDAWNPHGAAHGPLYKGVQRGYPQHLRCCSAKAGRKGDETASPFR